MKSLFSRGSLALATAVVCTAAAPAAALTDQQVDKAIHRIQQYFFKAQSEQGTWTSHEQAPVGQREAGGETALVTYAMLAGGAHAQDPRIQKSLKFLTQVEIGGTYARSLRNHVWAALPDRYRPLMETDTRWLLKAENGSGGYRYGLNVGNNWDNSATQYGVLGVWEAAKRGANINDAYWRRTLQHFLRTQNADGGWPYTTINNRAGRSRGSMTAAGLTVDFIALQQLHREQAAPPAKVKKSIRGGLNWLDEHFAADEHPGGPENWFYYYLYGIDRVGLASGVRFLKGEDWFEAGAKEIISRQDNDGKITSQYFDTAFGLLFLARGKVPVWINKLTLPDQPWNRRPSDLFYLSKFMSSYAERRVNWMRAPVGTDPRAWLNAPILYLSTNEAIDLNKQQRNHIKQYIRLGGMLVINPEGGDRLVSHSAQKLAEQLFPRYPMKPIGENHPLTDVVVDTPAARRVQHLSNGARDLILVLPDDWGMRWQAETGRQRSGPPWHFAINLFALATERGRLEGRLRNPLVPRKDRSDSGEMTMLRAKYDGYWNPEPGANEPLSNFLHNHTGVTLNVESQPLADIADAEAPLVHLAGTKRHGLSEQQIQAIKQYTQRGGTVLVETVGGQGPFAFNNEGNGVQGQLEKALGKTASRIPPTASLLTGDDLNNGFNCQQVQYRPYSVITTGAGRQANLTAIRVNDRPAIIISAEDLSLGLLDVPRWTVNGYQPKSARQLMTNILLTARQQGPLD